jgi:plasmid stabilization system protein ParE
VARIEFDARVALDVDRIVEHLLMHDAPAVQERIDEIIEACSVLERHPLIGCRTETGLRELVIGHGSRGYVALYDHDAGADLVLVLALKAQREAGYSR